MLPSTATFAVPLLNWVLDCDAGFPKARLTRTSPGLVVEIAVAELVMDWVGAGVFERALVITKVGVGVLVFTDWVVGVFVFASWLVGVGVFVITGWLVAVGVAVAVESDVGVGVAGAILTEPFQI